MSKILVEIKVPAADITRDVFIPYECHLYEIVELVKTALSEEVAHGFRGVDDTVLCDAETGQVFDINLTPEEVGLRNGSRLLLI
jgi:hypothetical protein